MSINYIMSIEYYFSNMYTRFYIFQQIIFDLCTSSILILIIYIKNRHKYSRKVRQLTLDHPNRCY